MISEYNLEYWNEYLKPNRLEVWSFQLFWWYDNLWIIVVIIVINQLALKTVFEIGSL